MKILNLTQHPATLEQLKAGVIDPPNVFHEVLKEVLTFNSRSTPKEIRARASFIAEIAYHVCNKEKNDNSTVINKVMIDGVVWLIPPLVAELKNRGFDVVFDFSQCVSANIPQPDGSVITITKRQHDGFITATGGRNYLPLT